MQVMSVLSYIQTVATYLQTTMQRLLETFILGVTGFSLQPFFFYSIFLTWTRYVFFIWNLLERREEKKRRNKKQERRGDNGSVSWGGDKELCVSLRHLTLTLTHTHTHASTSTKPIWLNPTNMDWWECPWTTRLIELPPLWQDGGVWREWWGLDETGRSDSYRKDA